VKEGKEERILEEMVPLPPPGGPRMRYVEAFRMEQEEKEREERAEERKTDSVKRCERVIRTDKTRKQLREMRRRGEVFGTQHKEEGTERDFCVSLRGLMMRAVDFFKKTSERGGLLAGR